MTGAPLPPGAEAVVMVEDTDFNVRTPGADAPQGGDDPQICPAG